MGILQQGVNNALTGAAFLMNQARALDKSKEKSMIKAAESLDKRMREANRVEDTVRRIKAKYGDKATIMVGNTELGATKADDKYVSDALQRSENRNGSFMAPPIIDIGKKNDQK